MAWRRLLSCIEQWPECESGEYNPACCRFPKSCSCTADDEEVPDYLLEPIGHVVVTDPADYRTEINTGTPRSYLWIEKDGDGNVELHLAQVDIGHVVVTDPTDEGET